MGPWGTEPVLPFPRPADTTGGATLFSKCRALAQGLRAWPPFFGTFSRRKKYIGQSMGSLPLPTSTTNWATLFLWCRTLTQRPRGWAPFLYPLARLIGPHGFRNTAPLRHPSTNGQYVPTNKNPRAKRTGDLVSQQYKLFSLYFGKFRIQHVGKLIKFLFTAADF